MLSADQLIDLANKDLHNAAIFEKAKKHKTSKEAQKLRERAKVYRDYSVLLNSPGFTEKDLQTMLESIEGKITRHETKVIQLGKRTPEGKEYIHVSNLDELKNQAKFLHIVLETDKKLAQA